MYLIKDYSFDQAEKLNVIIRASTRPKYKIDVYAKNGEYITSIGDKRYSDYPTFQQTDGEQYAKERRRLYRIRHKNDNGLRGYYALNILW